MLWSWSTRLVLIGLTDLPNLEGGELPAPLVPTALQDRKKRKILVAQQKGSMVNLSPSINYSCSQVTPFHLCLFLVSKRSSILFVLEICLVVQEFITYVSNLTSTFVFMITEWPMMHTGYLDWDWFLVWLAKEQGLNFCWMNTALLWRKNWENKKGKK